MIYYPATIPRGERLNTLSHLAGLLLSLVGTFFISYKCTSDQLLPISLYSFTLVFLYASSTLYHSSSGNANAFFHKLDHFAIYLLIAGTYTPFSLITLLKDNGIYLFSASWGLALLGIGIDFFSDRNGKRILPLVIYLVMGWMIVVAIDPLMENISLPGFWLLLYGGVAYTVGIFFYAGSDRYKHFHGIWHLFVMAGSCLHFFSIYYHVLG